MQKKSNWEMGTDRGVTVDLNAGLQNESREPLKLGMTLSFRLKEGKDFFLFSLSIVPIICELIFPKKAVYLLVFSVCNTTITARFDN